jgi:hypothetical protein
MLLKQTSANSATLEGLDSLRTMRRIAISTIPVLALLLVASPSAARVRHTTAPKCPPTKAHVLLANAGAELYVVKERLPYLNEPEPVIRGCAHGQKRSYLLGEAKEQIGGSGGGGSSGVKLETLAGTVVAYAESAVYGSGSREAPRYFMIVRNLSTGQVLHKVTTGVFVKPEAMPVNVGPITAIVVKRDGAVAWIVEAGYPDHLEYQVYAIDKAGSRLLASSSEIVPYSLALAGNTVYWTQNGQSASAPLN